MYALFFSFALFFLFTFLVGNCALNYFAYGIFQRTGGISAGVFIPIRTKKTASGCGVFDNF